MVNDDRDEVNEDLEVDEGLNECPGEQENKKIFGSLNVAVTVLVVQALLLVYQYYAHRYVTYPFFVILDLGLAYGTWRRNRIVIGVSLVYLGIDLFLAIMYLIAGVLLKGVIAFIDFLAIHDIVSYIMSVSTAEPEERRSEE